MEEKLREWGTCSSSSRSRRRRRRKRLMIVSLRAGTCPRHRCYPLDNNVWRKPGAQGGELRGKEGLKDVGIERICFSELLVYFNHFQITIWMQLHTNWYNSCPSELPSQYMMFNHQKLIGYNIAAVTRLNTILTNQQHNQNYCVRFYLSGWHGLGGSKTGVGEVGV